MDGPSYGLSEVMDYERPLLVQSNHLVPEKSTGYEGYGLRGVWLYWSITGTGLGVILVAGYQFTRTSTTSFLPKNSPNFTIIFFGVRPDPPPTLCSASPPPLGRKKFHSMYHIYIYIKWWVKQKWGRSRHGGMNWNMKWKFDENAYNK